MTIEMLLSGFAMKYIVILFVLFVAFSSATYCQTLDVNFPNPNYSGIDNLIRTIATDDNYTYIGGDFTYIGTNSGPGALISATTGIANTSYPIINGEINVVIPDGSGGWYIGGIFTAVGGVTRNRVAHINQDGSLDLTWNPNADGLVRSLALVGSDIYVGGEFNTIGGQTRNRIAKLNNTNGNADATWNPNADGNVRSIAIDGSDIYVGGHFLSIGGQTRNRIVKYSLTVSPTLSTINVTNISQSAATSGGNITEDGGASVTARGVVWDTNPNPTIALSSKTTDGSGTGSFTSQITGLKENTTYYLRAYATNSSGTSYGNQITFKTAISIENDGNQDGILDILQPNVVTITAATGGSFIGIESLGNLELKNVGKQLPNDPEFLYPVGLVKFQVNASAESVKLYFHGISNWNGYVYRKLNANNVYFTYSKAIFSIENIGGRNVGVVTLPLTDGGIEDYDGLLNGQILDPGGPAIPLGANIPIWDNLGRFVIIATLALFGFFVIRRYV